MSLWQSLVWNYSPYFQAVVVSSSAYSHNKSFIFCISQDYLPAGCCWWTKVRPEALALLVETPCCALGVLWTQAHPFAVRSSLFPMPLKALSHKWFITKDPASEFLRRKYSALAEQSPQRWWVKGCIITLRKCTYLWEELWLQSSQLQRQWPLEWFSSQSCSAWPQMCCCWQKARTSP